MRLIGGEVLVSSLATFFLILWPSSSAFAVDCSDTATTTIAASECNALVDLYTSTSGASWTTGTNWITSSTPCGWYGITCASGHVTGIDLHSNNLSGSLPSTIANLSSLIILILYDNHISGDLPSSFTSFNPYLVSLNGNDLTGTLPSDIGNMSHLIYFQVDDNDFSGAIPDSIYLLTNLTTLGLSGNAFTGAISSQISNLTSLENLFLKNNQLSGAIPSSLGSLASLEVLWLGNNLLSGTIPAELGNLSNLQTLDLYQNQLTGSIPSVLGNDTSLVQLRLFHNQLSGSIPSSLANLTNLQDLQLQQNQLSGTIPAGLSNLTALVTFNLGDNQLTGSIPTGLTNAMTSLQLLGLGTNQLSGTLPTTFGNLSSLQQLYLHNNAFTGTIPSSLGSLSSLTVLLLGHNQLTGTIPPEIGNLSNLVFFQLEHNALTCAIPDAISNLVHLQNIDISGYASALTLSSTHGVDISSNKLFSVNSSTLTFLNSLVSGWQSTQDADADGDGTYDCLDGCPGDANKTAAGMCGCGAIEVDENSNSTCDSSETRYAISGFVKLQNGNPFPGVTVGSGSHTAITGTNGAFSLSNLLPSSYTLSIQNPSSGYVFSSVSTVSLSHNVSGIVFQVTGCASGFSVDDTGYCIDSDLFPGIPTSVQASDGTSTTSVTVTYALTANASAYQIYRAPYVAGSDSFAGNLIGTSTTLSYGDSTAVPGVRYSYAARAINAHGQGVLSSPDMGWRSTGSSPAAADSDGDGVPDDQETADGTDPYDGGSFVTRLASPVFTKYNTYLGQLNWLELVSMGASTIHGHVSVFTLNGKMIGTPLPFSIDAKSEVDINIHDLAGEPDTYGVVRIDFNSNDEGVSLGGRLTVYRPDADTEYLPANEKSYSFAFARELRNAAKGSVFAVANSYDPQGLGHLTPNWLEIVNLDSVSRQFIVRIYDQKGQELYSSSAAHDANGIELAPITVAPYGERDIQAGHEWGEGVYLVEVVPIDGNAYYFATVARYGSDSYGGSEAQHYNFAMPLNAHAPSGEVHYAMIGNQQGSCWTQSNWLEIANTTSADATVDITFRNSAGESVGSTTTIIGPHAQEHLNAGSLVAAGDYGLAEISPRDAAAIISQSSVYFHDCKENILQSAYSSPSRIPGLAEQVGTYNSYLGMKTFLRLLNLTTETDSVGIQLRQTGRGLVADKQHEVPAKGSVELDLGNQTEFLTSRDTYGTVSLSMDDAQCLIADAIRIRERSGQVDFAIDTIVR